MFMKKAGETLTPKAQNTVLETLIKIAQKTKDSIIDVTANKYKNRFVFVDTVQGKHCGALLGDIDSFSKIGPNDLDPKDIGINIKVHYDDKIPEHFNKTGNPDERKTNLEDYANELIERFNTCETEKLDEIQTRETQRKLLEKLDGLVKHE